MIVGLVATAVSLYYYLAVIRALYLRPAAELQFAAAARRRATACCRRAWSRARRSLIGSFFAVQPLIDLAEKAVASL